MASVSNDEALMAEPLVKDVASQTNSPPSNNNQLCFRCKRSGVIATPIRVLNDRDADCSGSQKGSAYCWHNIICHAFTLIGFPVVIKSVEVKGSQTNPDKDDVEFVLQVSEGIYQVYISWEKLEICFRLSGPMVG